MLFFKQYFGKLMIIFTTIIINYARSQLFDDSIDTINAAAYYYNDDQNLICIPHDSKITCDCGNSEKRMMLQPLSGNVWHISISNCKSLTIASNLLINTHGIRSISLTNIDSLVLEEYAFSFPRTVSNNPLIIEFEKVNIEEMKSHAINGNIEEVSFSSGQIATIRPFGISSLKDNAVLLKFTNMLIDRIEPQAFKKFSVQQFEISNTVITSNLPSKAFYELEATNFKIYNCTFKTVHSRAFTFQAIGKLILVENHFGTADGEWLYADIQENVLIRNNYFGILNPLVFSGISVHRNYISSEKIELKFFNNSIYADDAIPLQFNKNFHLILTNLFYVKEFNCESKDKLRMSNFFKYNSDLIYFKVKDNNEFSNIAKVLGNDCIESSYLIYIIISVVILVVLIIVLIAILVYLRYKRKKNKQKLDIVIPEPRTYRETQIVLQIENAGLLKTDM